MQIADSSDGGYTGHVHDEVKLYAHQLFGIDESQIDDACVKVRCPRQRNGYDCGLCAIACAVDWAYRADDLLHDPFLTDSNTMRRFLQESFDRREFRTPFYRPA